MVCFKSITLLFFFLFVPLVICPLFNNLFWIVFLIPFYLFWGTLAITFVWLMTALRFRYTYLTYLHSRYIIPLHVCFKSVTVVYFKFPPPDFHAIIFIYCSFHVINTLLHPNYFLFKQYILFLILYKSHIIEFTPPQHVRFNVF